MIKKTGKLAAQMRESSMFKCTECEKGDWFPIRIDEIRKIIDESREGLYGILLDHDSGSKKIEGATDEQVLALHHLEEAFESALEII